MTHLRSIVVRLEIDTNKDTVSRHLSMSEGETTSEFAERVQETIVGLTEAVLA